MAEPMTPEKTASCKTAIDKLQADDCLTDACKNRFVCQRMMHAVILAQGPLSTSPRAELAGQGATETSTS